MDIFRDDSGRFHLLELLAELGARFGVRVQASGHLLCLNIGLDNGMAVAGYSLP